MLTPEQKGQPGYEGYLNERVVSLAEVLQTCGYHTYMAGKWHLGHSPEIIPHARGFEKSFSSLFGGASYWSDMFGMLADVEEVAEYVHNDKWLETLPKDFMQREVLPIFSSIPSVRIRMTANHFLPIWPLQLPMIRFMCRNHG